MTLDKKRNIKGAFMLQSQNIRNISELQGILDNNSAIINKVVDVFSEFKVCKVLQGINKYKEKGFEAFHVLSALLLLPFIVEETIHGMIKSPITLITDMQKDVFYRLKNDENIDWRKLLFSVAKRSLKIINKKSIKPEESSGDIISQVKCLVFDDTVIQKTGDKIEGISKVFDHVSNTFVLGFKMLGCCFWDGKSLNPLDFSLHSERGKKKKGKTFRPFGLTKKQLKERFSKKREKSTPGYERKKELTKSKIIMMLEMFQNAIVNGFVPDYVLMDKWFISEKILKEIRESKKGKIHVIAACKKDKRKYIYHGKAHTATELLKKNQEKKKRCRSLKTSYISILVEYKGIPIRLFFNKPGRRKNWELLVTTDVKLSFINALKIYRIRWGIEVFFKESKQHLLLGKCQSQDFDAQISDITLSMIRYILLNQYKRFSAYETLGEIFKDTRKFTLELTIGQRLWLVFLEICCELLEIFDMDEEMFMNKLFSIPVFEEMVYLYFAKSNNQQIFGIKNGSNVA